MRLSLLRTPKWRYTICMLNPSCIVKKLGCLDYQAAWDLQNELAQEIGAGRRPPTLLLLEHPHTYSFGRRGQAENLLWDAAELTRRGVGVHWVDRGGDVTYHGPGQLVGYPLLPLGTVVNAPGSDSPRLPQPDYVAYLRKLEQVLIDTLAALDLPAQRVEGLTGVWTPDPEAVAHPNLELPPAHQGLAKIAAIGVKVDARGVSRHGFALNVAPQMEMWGGIIGCGLQGYPVTSLERLLPGHTPTLSEVMNILVPCFGNIFGYQMESEEAG